MTVLNEHIDIVAVVEISRRLDLKALPVEVGGEDDLAGKMLPVVRLLRRTEPVSGSNQNGTARPSLNQSVWAVKSSGSNPVTVAVIRDTVGGIRAGAEEVMLGEVPHQPVAAQHECKRLDDRRFATVVGPDQNRVIAELNFACPDATKVLDLEKSNSHTTPATNMTSAFPPEHTTSSFCSYACNREHPQY